MEIEEVETLDLTLESSSGDLNVDVVATGPQGYSAYEIAVQEGYTGTKAQWLASLKGDTGATGATGAKGDTGDSGVYIGTTEPEESSIRVWIDTDGTPDGAVMQLATMPTATASNVNDIVEYIGTTTSTYTNGYFYKNVQTENTYAWTRINVQPETDITGKQDITDNTLVTTSKTVSGAISELNTRITNLQNIGRFLSIWNCTTGLPTTNPSSTPYAYKTGDYYRVGTVANGYTHSITMSGTTPSSGGLQPEYDGKTFTVTFSFTNNVATQYDDLSDISTALGIDDSVEATGNIDTSYTIYGVFAGIDSSTSDRMLALLDGYPYGQKMSILTENTATISSITDTVTGSITNYMPNGSSYTGTASTTAYSGSETLNTGSVFYYDGTTWNLQTSGGSGNGVWGGITGTLSNQTDLNTALNGKQDTIVFNTTYNASTNKAATMADISAAIITGLGGDY